MVFEQIDIWAACSALFASDHNIKAPNQNVTVLFVTSWSRKLQTDTWDAVHRYHPVTVPTYLRTLWVVGHYGTAHIMERFCHAIMSADILGHSVNLGPNIYCLYKIVLLCV